jgi:hypothetical protein
LGAGFGVAFVMSQIRPVFFDGTALRKSAQLPLLGVVDTILNADIRRRESRSLKLFFVALLVLAFLYAGGMLALSYQTGSLADLKL